MATKPIKNKNNTCYLIDITLIFYDSKEVFYKKIGKKLGKCEKVFLKIKKRRK
jgi:hypothetical protein